MADPVDVALFREAFARRQVSDPTYAGCVAAGLDAVAERRDRRVAARVLLEVADGPLVNEHGARKLRERADALTAAQPAQIAAGGLDPADAHPTNHTAPTSAQGRSGRPETAPPSTLRRRRTPGVPGEGSGGPAPQERSERAGGGEAAP